jgi:hypothetical protein
MSGPEAADAVDLYLDGLLPPAEASRFEARLALDPELAAIVATQRRLDGTLRSAFAPPPAPLAVPIPLHLAGTRPVEAPTRDAAPAHADAPIRISAWRSKAALTRIAAAFMLLALAGYTFYTQHITAFAPVDPTVAYAKELAGGFRPYEVCENDEQVASLTTQAIGTALSIATAADVHLVGWGYRSNVLSEDTVTLLATAGPDKIVIYMDRAAADRFLPEETDPNVNVFRREAFGAVFYEVSPRAEATILPLVQKAKR